MPIPVTPSGQPMPQKQLPPGYYRDQQGRIFDSAGRQVDPSTLRLIQGGAHSGAIGPQPASRSPITPPTNPSPASPPQPAASKPPVAAGPPPNPGPRTVTDQYGTHRVNTNAPGVQSNGDDDPWLIGAAGQGGTYDPETVLRWIDRARKGDAGAAWVLQQIDLSPQDGSLENWAKRRGLTTRDEAFAPGGWYGAGAQQREVAPTGGVARDQGNQTVDEFDNVPQKFPNAGPGPLYDNNGVASHTPPPDYGADMGFPSGAASASQGGGSRGRGDGYFDPTDLAVQGNTGKPGLYDDPQPVPDAPQAQSKKLAKPYFDWGS